MVEADRVYAWTAHRTAAAGARVTSPGVIITPRTVATMLNVRCDPADAAAADSIVRTYGVHLPMVGRSTSGTNGTRALWLGPDEWLIVSTPHLDAAMGPGNLRAASESAHAGDLAACSAEGAPGLTLTDVSHGRAVLRVSGRDVRAALAKGCTLDLDPRSFAVDRCAQTPIARIAIIIDHVQPGVYDLYCARSYTGSFWQWLNEAAAEYGCMVSLQD